MAAKIGCLSYAEENVNRHRQVTAEKEEAEGAQRNVNFAKTLVTLVLRGEILKRQKVKHLLYKATFGI